MKDKQVFVIGGSRGIGLAIGELCAERGAVVTLVARDLVRLREAAAQIRGDTHIAAVDVCSEAAVAQWAAGVGSVDHVVVAVGNLYLSEVRSIDITAAQAVFDSKFWAALIIAKHIGPRIRPKGSLLFLAGGGSGSDWRPTQSWAVTAAANAGIVVLAQTLALELAPTRVNVVSPGHIVKSNESVADEEMPFLLPAGHSGTAVDVAKICVAIMENGFVTGVSIAVDGGAHLI